MGLVVRVVVVVAAFALVIAGCATGYHPSGFGGGYSEIQLNSRTFQVHFAGNGYTSNAATQRGAMHRAAELTIERGFYGFWVANQGTNVATSTYTQPLNCTTIGTSTTCSGGNTQLIQKPDATLTIGMVTWEETRRAPPGTIIYEARLILSQMAH